MFVHRLTPLCLALTLFAGPPVAAQRQQSQVTDPAREKARVPYDEGVAHMRREAFDAAAKSFQQAVEIDPSFDMAYYMLGRTHLVQKNYASAVVALTRCRDLHLAASSRQFVNKQELQRYRRERINEISDRIGQLSAVVPQTPAIREEIRQLEERKRQLDDADRQLTPEKAVPAYVSLSLGSAYFRSGKMNDAEKAYLASLAADAKVGEAHNNLAVVYMETGRLDEAEKAVKAAEKAGLRVNPALKDEIKKRKVRGSL